MASIPDWLGKAIIGATFAALGYFGKMYIDYLNRKRTQRKNFGFQLNKLSSLLQESYSIFKSHNYQIRRLMSMLREKYPNETSLNLGFDETFYRLYPKFNEEERELHSLVRGTTENSMRRVNEELLNWYEDNLGLISESRKHKQEIEDLIEQLSLLKLHLNQWFDKYNSVFLKDKKRTLVYLADEKNMELVSQRTLSQH